MSKQKFTLNTTAMLEDADVEARFQEIDPSLRDFLIEGYNPILDELEKLYKKSPDLTKSDLRVKELSDKISLQLKSMGWDEAKIEKSLSYEENLGGSGEAMPKHLASLRRDLDHGKSLGNSLKSLSDRLTGQTKKDFNRINFTLIDQNGKAIKLDDQDNISNAINDRVKKNGGKYSYFEEFQKALHLTDEQFNLILCRFNQRGIEGAGMAIVTKAHADGPRENNLYVIVNEKGEIEGVSAVENKYTVQKLLSKISVLSNGQEVEDFVQDENGEVVKVPVSKIAYKVDISNLKGVGKELGMVLPTQKTKETLKFEALDDAAIYSIPEVLKHKTYNNILLSQKTKMSENQVIKMIRTPGIKEELTIDGYHKLVELVTPKIIKAILKDEIHKVKRGNPDLSNKAIAKDVQNNISNILSKPEMKKDKGLNQHLNDFLEHQDPGLLTKISHYIHATFKGLSIRHYEAIKVKKQKFKVVDAIISKPARSR